MSATLRCRGSPRKRGRSSTSTLSASRAAISRDAHRAGPGRGDLDRERQAVESAAQVDDDRRGRRRRPSAPASRQRSRNSCTDGHASGRRPSAGTANGASETIDSPGTSSGRAAGGQDRRLLAGAEHLHDRGGHGIEQVLAVVDDQQHGPIGRRAEQRVERVEAELRGDGAGYDRLVVDARQIDEAHPSDRREAVGRGGRAPSCRRRRGPRRDETIAHRVRRAQRSLVR